MSSYAVDLASGAFTSGFIEGVLPNLSESVQAQFFDVLKDVVAYRRGVSTICGAESYGFLGERSLPAVAAADGLGSVSRFLLTEEDLRDAGHRSDVGKNDSGGSECGSEALGHEKIAAYDRRSEHVAGVGGGKYRLRRYKHTDGISVALNSDVKCVEFGDAKKVQSLGTVEGVDITYRCDESVGVESQHAFVAGSSQGQNKKKRDAKKQRKQRRKDLNLDWRLRGSERLTSCEKTELQKSSELKWKMQNELAAEKARRELEILRKSDLEKELNRYRTKVQVATEKNMVAIEKTHAVLAATGNVPEAFHGSAHTVVDGEIVDGVPSLTEGGCTISPDSSASMAEYRACQKRNLDLEAKLEKVAVLLGVSVDSLDDFDKVTWTDNTDSEERLDAIYPDGFGKTPHPLCDGKFQVVRCSY